MNELKSLDHMHKPAMVNPHADQAVYFLHKQQQIVQNKIQSFGQQNYQASHEIKGGFASHEIKRKHVVRGKAYSDKQTPKQTDKSSP